MSTEYDCVHEMHNCWCVVEAKARLPKEPKSFDENWATLLEHMSRPAKVEPTVAPQTPAHIVPVPSTDDYVGYSHSNEFQRQVPVMDHPHWLVTSVAPVAVIPQPDEVEGTPWTGRSIYGELVDLGLWYPRGHSLRTW